MDITVAALAFGVVFLAELPDKTALAGLMLGARYRAGYVFCGIAAAFTVHVLLAVVAGSLLATLPHQLLKGIVATVFLAGAVALLLRREGGEADAASTVAAPSFWRVAGAGFSVVLMAEFGDLTQLMTANLAARYDAPLSVGVGSLLALWSVAGIAIVGGRSLLKVLPITAITRIAAAVMLVMAGLSLYEAVTG